MANIDRELEELKREDHEAAEKQRKKKEEKKEELKEEERQENKLIKALAELK